MRDILFRGKRVDNGEWVEGHYYEYTLYGKKIICISVPADDSIVGHQCYDVDPDTVGQYTGLTDKNGKKIFEGDIVRHPNGQTYEMVFIEKYSCYYFVRKSSVYAGIKPKDIEVIGNIYDNHELLEMEK